MITVMKPIRYVRHARNRMRLYDISEAEVEMAIQDPECLEHSRESRLNAWKELSGRFLSPNPPPKIEFGSYWGGFIVNCTHPLVNTKIL